MTSLFWFALQCGEELAEGFLKGLAIAALAVGTGALVFDGAPTGLHPTGFDPTIAGERP